MGAAPPDPWSWCAARRRDSHTHPRGRPLAHPPQGGRLRAASDGFWAHITHERARVSRVVCRGLGVYTRRSPEIGCQQEMWSTPMGGYDPHARHVDVLPQPEQRNWGALPGPLLNHPLGHHGPHAGVRPPHGARPPPGAGAPPPLFIAGIDPRRPHHMNGPLPPPPPHMFPPHMMPPHMGPPSRMPSPHARARARHAPQRPQHPPMMGGQPPMFGGPQGMPGPGGAMAGAAGAPFGRGPPPGPDSMPRCAGPYPCGPAGDSHAPFGTPSTHELPPPHARHPFQPQHPQHHACGGGAPTPSPGAPGCHAYVSSAPTHGLTPAMGGAEPPHSAAHHAAAHQPPSHHHAQLGSSQGPPSAFPADPGAGVPADPGAGVGQHATVAATNDPPAAEAAEGGKQSSSARGWGAERGRATAPSADGFPLKKRLLGDRLHAKIAANEPELADEMTYALVMENSDEKLIELVSVRRPSPLLCESASVSACDPPPIAPASACAPPPYTSCKPSC